MSHSGFPTRLHTIITGGVCWYWNPISQRFWFRGSGVRPQSLHISTLELQPCAVHLQPGAHHLSWPLTSPLSAELFPEPSGTPILSSAFSHGLLFTSCLNENMLPCEDATSPADPWSGSCSSCPVLGASGQEAGLVFSSLLTAAPRRGPCLHGEVRGCSDSTFRAAVVSQLPVYSASFTELSFLRVFLLTPVPQYFSGLHLLFRRWFPILQFCELNTLHLFLLTTWST